MNFEKLRELTKEELINIISTKANYKDIAKILIENVEYEDELQDLINFSEIDLSYYITDEMKNIIIDEVVDREILVEYLDPVNRERALGEAVYYDRFEALHIIERYDTDILRHIIEKYNYAE